MKLKSFPRFLFIAGIIVPALFCLMYVLSYADDSKPNLNTISWEDFKKQKEISPYERKESANLDNDSFKEEYILSRGRLEIRENSKTLWKSPETWWIDDFCLADSTGDGIIDINLSLWRSGCFGKSKPFWIEENDMSIKNHFFVLDLRGNKVKHIWGSSNLSQPNVKFTFSDWDKDGKQELVVIEGNYADYPDLKGRYIAVWRWTGWGFFNEWRHRT